MYSALEREGKQPRGPELASRKIMPHIKGSEGGPTFSSLAFVCKVASGWSVAKVRPLSASVPWDPVAKSGEGARELGRSHTLASLLPRSSGSKASGRRRSRKITSKPHPRLRLCLPLRRAQQNPPDKLFKNADSWALLPEIPFCRFGVEPRICILIGDIAVGSRAHMGRDPGR